MNCETKLSNGVIVELEPMGPNLQAFNLKTGDLYSSIDLTDEDAESIMVLIKNYLLSKKKTGDGK